MPGISNETTRIAGEQCVAAELKRRGVWVTPYSGEVRGLDIVATDSSHQSTAYLYVTTKSAGSKNWQSDLKYGWAKITTKECPNNGDCAKDCTPTLEEPIPGKPDHYWVFVSLLKDGGQEYFIVPDDHVRRHMIREGHLAYLDKNGGQRPRGNHDSLHRSFSARDVEAWKDRWDSLGIGPLSIE